MINDFPLGWYDKITQSKQRTCHVLSQNHWDYVRLGRWRGEFETACCSTSGRFLLMFATDKPAVVSIRSAADINAQADRTSASTRRPDSTFPSRRYCLDSVEIRGFGLLLRCEPTICAPRAGQGDREARDGSGRGRSIFDQSPPLRT